MKKNISFEKKITFPTMIGEISAIDLEHDLKFIDESNVEGSFIVKGKYKLTEASRLEEDFNYKIPTEIVLTEKLDLQTAHIDIKDFYYEIENDDTMVCYIEIQLEGLEKIELEEELVRNALEEDERECDGDIKTDEEKEIPHKEVKESVDKEVEETKEVEVINTPTEEVSNERNEEVEAEILNEETIKNEEAVTKQFTEKEESVTMNEENYINNTYENTEEDSEQVESLSNIFSSLSEKEETFATYSVYILREDESVNSIIEKYKTTKEELEKYNDLNTLTKGSKIIIPYLNND